MKNAKPTPSQDARGQSSTTTLSRFFDPRYNRWVIKILPGTQYVTCDHEEMLVTTLGSCVSACVRDERTGYSGMNHFMLPGDSDCDWDGVGFSLRFGHFAMESLLNAFFAMGSSKQDLMVKVFGGGNVIRSSQKIGNNNAKFVIDYLHKEGIEIISSDLGGDRARRINFFPDDGRVQRKFIEAPELKSSGLAVDEDRYHESLSKERKSSGSIELFE